MSGGFRVAKFSVKSVTKRSFLLFCCAVLVFTLTMPVQTQAWSLFGDGKAKRDPSILPASEVKTTSTQAIADAAPSLAEPLKKPVDRRHDHEIESKRTPFTSTYVNKDGTKTLEYSFDQQNYKVGNKWEKIDNTLKAVTTPVKSLNLFEQLTNTAPEPEVTKYTGMGGVINAQMKPLREGLDIAVGDKTINMKPLGANNVKPSQKDARTVVYKNAWDGVDLEYELRGESVKEVVVLKKKINNPVFDFKITGGKVIQHPTKTGLLTIEDMPEDFTFSSLTVDVNERGVISEERAAQVATKDGIQISLDKAWLKSLKVGDFPIRIDPSFGRDATNYSMRKSDGYGCGSSNCYANTGTIMDGTWKHWRTYFHFPFSDMAGKKILNANLHGFYKTGVGGTGEGRTIWMGRAHCNNGFHCYSWDVGAAGGIGGDFDINFTGGMQDAVNSGDWGRWWGLHGEEGPYKSFKPYWNLQAGITYDTPTPIATPADPAHGQVTVSTQPTLRVNPVSDADGDAVKYYYRVSTSSDAETGAVINSGWTPASQWTIPDGILQDGTTYYWHVYTLGATQTDPNWVRSFKVDLRTGKDSTQAYDTVGPIGVDLATGNATTDAGTHTMSALGGNIGLSFNYNTPAKSQVGLTGEYWNIPANYSGDVPTSTPNHTRNDLKIDFNWPNGSSPDGSIQQDWFYARWKGNFIAPTTGSYSFGANVDDAITIIVNGQTVYSGGCSSGVCYNQSINLTAGQAVPLDIRYIEATGNGYMKLYVKGAVAEQIVPQDWLKTEVKATTSQYGLQGRYYTDDGSHNFPTNNSDPMRLMMVRNDSKLSFNWGSGGPASGLQADNFMTRWTGYITVPTTGSYTFGATTDDGVRIKLNNGLLGAEQTVLNSWQDQAATVWGSATNLTAGQQVPITVDYFEHGGGAQLNLLIRGSNLGDQEIPVKWLTPKATALPDAWRLGVDVDGDVGYERLRVVGQNVVLEDSTRATHEYTWTGSGFKPPVNEDGQLTRNTNNTYTLLDTDGRTYVFDAEGKLISLTSPTDDRNPASLKYEYSGDPARLVKITDGVTDGRHGTLHYKGINEEGNCSVPNGFDAAPDGMLCAFKTSDGDVTKLYYKAGQLSRVEKPGSELTDYGYDGLGRIISTRDSTANDAIAANIRSDDTTVLTEVTYDGLGRANAIKAPAATVGADRVNHTFEHLVGATQMHITGTPEPNGFSKRVEYDSLLRTTREIDVAGLSSLTEWDAIKDLELSKTDPTGLKSTSLYDADDRPVENYGPAPSAWFGADRKPSAAYINQVPKTTTGYDEGINGPAVSYMAIAQRASSVLSNGETLTRGQDRWSTDGRFRFVYQTDGNVVLYGPNGAIWSNNKSGAASDRLVMQSDGNLVLYNGPTAIWATGTNGGSSSRLVVANDGNTFILTTNGATWATNTANWSSTAGAGLTALKGAPLLNTTNLVENSAQVSNTWTTSPLSSGSNYWGVRMTGKLYLPTTGNWTFRIVSDNGVRMSINDNVVIDDWSDGLSRSHPTYTFNNTASAQTPHRFSIDYYHLGGTNANFTLYMTPPGGSETANVAQYIKPGYSLKTSETAYDLELGNVTTKTAYNKPEYGLVDKTTLDPTGLNLETTSTYETPGNGFLRQTSKTLPGGGTTTYQHYSATESRDNPCTTETESIHQGGRPKGKGEADPDGAGSQTSRTSETVYNASGEVVATRYNNDDWTCTEYDSRGRVQRTVIPSLGNKPGRTIVNDYAKDSNPLITTTTDDSGTIRVENDLLGRTIKYIDAKGKVTENTYDTYGKLTSRTSPIGTETYEYDNYDRLTVQKLDGVTFATVTYDAFSRLATVQYPAGISLSSITRDTLGRENGTSFTVNGQQYTDSIERYVSGDIKQGTENGTTKSYTYDNAGRLTGATIGSNTFAYEFGTPDTSCSSTPGYNATAAKNGNRTKLTMNGQSTTYCYDMADRLISSSDPTLTDVQYDSRGNTTSLGDGTHRTEFGYDASDRNTSIKAGDKETYFTRDAQDRIVGREHKENGSATSNVGYGFTGSGDSPDFLLDGNGDVIQKYVTLPGDVLVTIKPQSTSAGAVTYSLPNIHGDIYLTVDADGLVKATHQTGPFGEALPNQTNPANTATGTSWNYVGQHQKLTDTDTSSIQGGIIQMGARVYVPALGRFLQMDPIEGAGDTAYSYVNDPVNEEDLDGKIAPLVAFAAWQLGRIAIQQTIKVAAQYAAKQAVRQVAKKTFVSAGKKEIQKASPKKIGFVDKLANSKHFGTTSKLFGNNKFVNPSGYGKFTPGRWNTPGRNLKIGWSNIGNRYVFRVGIGKKSPTSNISKYHINLLKGGKIRGW